MEWLAAGVALAAFGALGIAFGMWVGRRLAWTGSGRTPVPEPFSVPQEPAEQVPSHEVVAVPSGDPKEAIYATAQGAFEDLQRAARPSHLLGAEGFERCVETMRHSPLSDADLAGFVSGDVLVLAVCAAEALARRPGDRDTRDRLLASFNDVHPYTRAFALRAITAATPATESVTGVVLPALGESWRYPALRTILADFVLERIAAGDVPTVQGMRAELSDEACVLLPDLLGPLKSPQIDAFLAGVAEVRSARVDETFLRSVGSFPEPGDGGIVVEHPRFVAARDAILGALERTPPRPVLLVGAGGTGRSTLVLAVWRALRAKGWRLFQAGHMDLVAGQSYVGQIEGQVRQLVEELARARRMLWVAPFFQGFLFAGRHSGSPVGLLDLLLPAATEGRFPLIAVTDPAGLDVIARNKPAVLTAFEIVRLDPLPEEESLDVARQWDARRPAPPPALAEPVLREASHLAGQYLREMAAPGNLVHLLATLLQERGGAPERPVTVDDVVATVAKLTRLPADVLDERQGLDLDRVGHFFASRVIGQQEAVETLVERVAMIKAGVTDPTRPLGVFLFAGPTGTGKTEIAKALAEWLFGSPERLVRIDMSELQTPESLARLLGDGQRDVSGNALVDQIRRHPFSVVLLDEFEKSHPQVWDLFLQVFDDGRLTDPRGLTADFRNCIIILTSNLGSALPAGPALGFGAAPRPAPERVEQAVSRAFRPEFFNRIDRIVVFRPLSRDVLRDILHKELRDVFKRRGLRNRDWAVMWDESAIDFLLDRGTTPDLGARPLKRAIERHVLAPLARTIVEHEVPRGDQFLLVRAKGDHLEAEFIDPDAEVPAPPAPAGDTQTRLEGVALDPRGSDEEVACLESHLDSLAERIGEEGWRERKRAALERQRDPGFWDSPGRFSVFGQIEQIDRIEGGVESARRLFEKLRGSPGAGRTRFGADHAGRLALRLHLLETAVADVEQRRPLDAFLSIEAIDPGDERRAATERFFERLATMYRAWGEKRGMKVETLLSEDDRAPRVVLAVSGLAAHTLLFPEAGLHLLEEPGEKGHGFDRVQVRVRVAAQPEIPPSDGTAGLRRQAIEAFAGAAPSNIARRYRERPSALVRDQARGWRTGRIDLVFGGDFDLLAGARESDDDDRDDA